jgi:hypothetical protein
VATKKRNYQNPAWQERTTAVPSIYLDTRKLALGNGFQKIGHQNWLWERLSSAVLALERGSLPAKGSRQKRKDVGMDKDTAKEARPGPYASHRGPRQRHGSTRDDIHLEWKELSLALEQYIRMP